MKANITDLRKSVVQILKETDDTEVMKESLLKMIDNVAQLNDELEAKIAYFSQQEANLKSMLKNLRESQLAAITELTEAANLSEYEALEVLEAFKDYVSSQEY